MRFRRGEAMTMRGALSIAVLSAAALWAALPAAALGAANHPFLGAITKSAGGQEFEDACGLALHGGLWVADYYHDQVDPPSGSALSPADPEGGPCKLAFDSGGDLYLYGYHHDVLRYGSGELLPGKGAPIDPRPTEASTEAPTGLALDPATGDLYVAHRTYIAKYEAPVHAGEVPTKIGLDPNAAYYGIAVSAFPGSGAQPATAGDLYVPDAKDNTVKVFDPATSLSVPVMVMDGAATPQGGFKYLIDSEAAVDNNPSSPSYGHVFVLDAVGHGLSEHPEAVLDEFNAAGAYRGQVKGFTDAEPSGIAIDPATGNVYVTSGNSEGSAVFVYGPTAPAHSLKVTKSGTGGGTVTSSPAGIACGGACAAEFNEGQTVTLFAAPDAHSVFSGWTVSGPGAEPCPGLGSCTVLLSANREVVAGFEEPAQQTLEVSVSGSGTVRSEPAGISCPSSCTEQFSEGRVVTLTASPASHSRFLEWQGLACDESTATTCQVTMSQAESLTAQFAPIPPETLSVSLGGSGEGTVMSAPAGIDCPGACSASFDEGSQVTLTAIAAPGSAFAGWSGAGCSGTATTCTVAMTEAEALSAQFTQPSPPAAPAAAQASATLAPSLDPLAAPNAPQGPRPHKRKHRSHHHHHTPHRRH
jgi:Divergent InlB B-repeat domain